MRRKKKNELAIQEALASTRMEGLTVTPEIERNVRRILSGETTVEERIRQLKENWGKERV